jgi:hypothetical protein
VAAAEPPDRAAVLWDMIGLRKFASQKGSAGRGL